MREPQSLGEVLARSGLGKPGGQKLKLGLIQAGWNRLVGDRLADHSAPTKLSRGVLSVAADGPAWASELSVITGDLMSSLELMLGKGAVRKIRIRSSTFSSRRDTGIEGEENIYSSPAKNAENIPGLESIRDVEMREAVARALRASRARKQSKGKKDTG